MTTSPGTVIDLGEEHGAVPAGGLPRRPGRRWSPPTWLGPGRLAGLAVVVALALATGGAASRPGPPLRLVARLAVSDGSSVMVDGDLVMVLGDGQAVTAYSVRTGARAWRSPVSVPPDEASMTVSEGVLLVARDQGRPGYDNTEALDEATGRVLWRSQSTLFLPLTGTGTALLQPVTTAAVQLVGVRTGVPRWSASTDGCQFTFDRQRIPPEPDAFALLCVGGRLDVVHLPTGTVSALRLPAAGGVDPSVAAQLITAGPVLVVERPTGADSTVIEAYRWRDGGLLWSRSGFDTQDILYPCDDYLCVESHGLGVAFDPATGADVRAPELRFPVCCNPDLQHAPDQVGTLLLVPVGRSVPVPPPASIVVRVQPPASSQLLQPYVVEAATRSTLIEIVDAKGQVQPLQELPGVTADDCTAIDAYLVCPTAPGEVSVWRLPSQ